MPRAREEMLRVQLGQETTAGTPVAATAILAQLNEIRYRPDDQIMTPQTRRGSLAQFDEATPLARGAQVLTAGYLTFEDLPYYLEAGYRHVTPTSDSGTPPAYTRVYAPTLTAEDAPQTFTLEVGNNVESWRVPYAFVSELQFAARVRELTTFQATWRGQDYAVQAFTTGLSRRVVERVPAMAWRVFVDDVTGTIGTTEITGCLTRVEFRSGPLYAPVFCINGQLLFEGVTQQGQAPQLTLTFHIDAFTQGLLSAYRAGTKKLVRLVAEGSQIHDGPPPVRKRVQIDMAANITEWAEAGNQSEEGALVLPVTFQGAEDTGGTWGKLIEYTIVNQVATLP